MIVFNIILNNEKKVDEISSYLIKHKYALQTHIDKNTILNSEGRRKTIRLFFITKSLLYNTIETEVKKLFFSKEMIIYATPVSHINAEYASLLREKIKAI